MPEPVEPADGAPPRGPMARTAAPEHPDESAVTLRERLQEAADARRVPLATILTAVGVVVGAGFILLLLWVLRLEVLYIVVACFVALLLHPPVRFLENRGLSRGVAATAVFLIGVVVFGGIIYLFSVPLVGAVTHLAQELPHLVRQAQHGRGSIGHLLVQLHLQNWVEHNAPKLTQDITKVLKPAQALSVGAAAVSTLIALTTIAVLSFFVLLEAPMLWRSFLGLLPPARAARVRRVSSEVSRSVLGYMLGNAVTSVIAGIVVLITLTILGVPYPWLFGLWVALVDLLPLVGGLLAGVPTVVVALLHSPVAGIVTLAVFLIYQQVENHVLNPVVMSRTVRLNPVFVLIAVLVGAKLGSVVGSGLGAFIGALIGIPVGGALSVIWREVRRAPSDPPASVP